jgi:hypothetical protein
MAAHALIMEDDPETGYLEAETHRAQTHALERP